MPDVCDEVRFEQICRRHGIVGLVVARMRSEGLPVPKRLAQWDAGAERIVMAQWLAAMRLRDCFEGAGIPVLFLKGIALSQRIWGSALIRRAADIDVLIAPQHVDAAWQALMAAGYSMIRPARVLPPGVSGLYRLVSKDSLHEDTGMSVSIELHWRMSDAMASPGFPLEGDRRRVVLAPGQSLEMLADEAQFVYLCTHGAGHAWARLKWLADIAGLMAVSADGGQAMWQRALAEGAQIPAASAILLCEEFFETRRPPGFQSPSTWRLSWLNRLARHAILGGGGIRDHATTGWRGWSEMAAQGLVAVGWPARLAILRRLAVAGEDVASLALPRPLSFLYPLLRIPMLVSRRWRRGRRLVQAGHAGAMRAR